MHSDYLVIDTNILISGLLFPKSSPNLAVKKALLGYTICVSQATFDEFLEVSARPKFAKYLVTGDKKDLLSMNPYRNVEIISVNEFLAETR